MKYLVSHEGQQIGPFSLDEIVGKVRTRELDLFDYVFDSEKDDWVLLMEYPALAAKMKGSKPSRPPQVGIGTTTGAVATASAPPTVRDANPHAITEWFVLKGQNRFGPFGYMDIVKMLQQKVIFPFDFIWHTGIDGWKRVTEMPEFTSESIKKMFSEPGSKDIFIQRRFRRTKYAARVIVHDGHTLWRGQGFEISKGGVGVTMQNLMVLPGQQLTLHFHGHEDWPAFNATCEVVSKKFVPVKNGEAPVEYGLRFLSLTQDIQEQFYKKVA